MNAERTVPCDCTTHSLAATPSPPADFAVVPQSRESNEHGGFIVIRSRNVRAKTGGSASRGGGGGAAFGTPGSVMTPTRPGVTPQSPAAFGMRMTPQSPAPGRPGAVGAMGDRRGPAPGMYSGGRANQARRDSALIGQTIKISKGQWRGYCVRALPPLPVTSGDDRHCPPCWHPYRHCKVLTFCIHPCSTCHTMLVYVLWSWVYMCRWRRLSVFRGVACQPGLIYGRSTGRSV